MPRTVSMYFGSGRRIAEFRRRLVMCTSMARLSRSLTYQPPTWSPRATRARSSLERVRVGLHQRLQQVDSVRVSPTSLSP